MSLFEVIDLGDETGQPSTPLEDASRNYSLISERNVTLLVQEDIEIASDILEVAATSENGSSIDIFDTIFISDDEGPSDNSSPSDGPVFEVVGTKRKNRSPHSKSSKRAKKDSSSVVEHHDTPIDQVKINGLLLQPQTNVQLRYGALLSDRTILENGYFLRIKRIFRRREVYKNGAEIIQLWLHGSLFRRHRDLDGILPKTAGEVALLQEKVDVRASDVFNVREIILTNLLGRDSVRKSYEDAKDESYGRLVCRWKAKIKDNINGNTGMQQLGATGYIRRLTETEADPNYRIGDKELSKIWRAIPEASSTIKNNIIKPNISSISLCEPVNEAASSKSTIGEDLEIIDLCEQSVIQTKKVGSLYSPIVIAEDQKASLFSNKWAPRKRCRRRRKYTFGDAFCGAGGATCGAVMAGFKVRWGVDHDEAAISAWRSNFGRSLGYQEDVHEFVSRNSKLTTRVDLLHLSPPCQFFSWARTIPGKNDEKNEASFFVVPNTLNSCRPRAVTVEETDGLIGLSRSVGHFKCMLGDFTSMGYSVKYAVLNAAQYGVPSKRKRLVLIACCPGETLADFPNPTHFYSSDPFEPMPVGLQRAVTLREAITRIPRFSPDHDIEILETVAPSSLKLPPHEWDQPFRSTIKCGGGEYNLHPSRNRKFTLRELACLQSFPIDHLFYGKRGEKMRQIGNAFPPKLVGAVMESVRKHLEKTDDEWEGGGVL
ncbi:hypothetical protein TWF694_010710 [Orbilia ellipsospora]|uniref:DNA (cytosine-5-)-methyltransferase n=1 Tax=Orbilia ellipsospora TaxID=2528407 RepID=A0AAV9X6U6_9PEZI